jgi:hypothetical protein
VVLRQQRCQPAFLVYSMTWGRYFRETDVSA